MSSSCASLNANMAVGQNQWHHFLVGAPPILVYFSGDWDVHWGYGLLTHGHIASTPEIIASSPCQRSFTWGSLKSAFGIIVKLQIHLPTSQQFAGGSVAAKGTMRIFLRVLFMIKVA